MQSPLHTHAKQTITLKIIGFFGAVLVPRVIKNMKSELKNKLKSGRMRINLKCHQETNFKLQLIKHSKSEKTTILQLRMMLTIESERKMYFILGIY